MFNRKLTRPYINLVSVYRGGKGRSEVTTLCVENGGTQFLSVRETEAIGRENFMMKYAEGVPVLGAKRVPAV